MGARYYALADWQEAGIEFQYVSCHGGRLETVAEVAESFGVDATVLWRTTRWTDQFDRPISAVPTEELRRATVRLYDRFDPSTVEKLHGFVTETRTAIHDAVDLGTVDRVRRHRTVADGATREEIAEEVGEERYRVLRVEDTLGPLDALLSTARSHDDVGVWYTD